MEESVHSVSSLQENANDQASTSTFSRCEDVSRMKDLEDTFEERYTKLRAVAVRLKKKTVEQDEKLKSQDSEIQSLKDALEKSSKENNTLAKRVQVLQSEVDRQQDLLDGARSSLKASERDLERSVMETVNCKEQLAKLNDGEARMKNDIEALEREKASLDASVRELRTCAEQFAKECEAQRIVVADKEKQLDEEKQEHEKTRQKLQEEADKVKKVQTDLNNAQQDGRQHGYLELELADYEKTAKQLTKQLQEKEMKMKEMKSALADKEKEAEQCRLKSDELELSFIKQKEHSATLSARLQEAQSQRQTVDHSIADLQSEIETMNAKLERIAEERDALRMEMQEEIGNATQRQSNADQRITALQTQLRSLESERNRLSERLTDTRSELDGCRREFDVYRQRAQGILRQKEEQLSELQTKRDSAATEETTGDSTSPEQNSLSAESGPVDVKQLESELSTLRGTVESLERVGARQAKELEELRSERADVMERLRMNTSVTSALETQLQTKEKAIRESKIEIDAIVSSYKHKLQVQSDEHTQQDDALRRRVTELEEQLKRAQDSLAQSSASNKNQHHHNSHSSAAGVNSSAGGGGAFHPSHLRLSPPSVLATLLERGEGEGSESVNDSDILNLNVSGGQLEPGASGFQHSPANSFDQNGTTAGAGFMPLDQLLASPLVDARHHSKRGSRDLVSAEQHNLQDELKRVQNQLESSEKRSEHLSSLLCEAESDRARLDQLISALKEEIRKFQRQEEREQHAQNLEYLKNVIVKFLTLPGGKERHSLLPVLNTMLRLSSDEFQQLKEVCGAQELDLLSPTSGQNKRPGWGLHLWSGGGK